MRCPRCGRRTWRGSHLMNWQYCWTCDFDFNVESTFYYDKIRWFWLLNNSIGFPEGAD